MDMKNNQLIEYINFQTYEYPNCMSNQITYTMKCLKLN